jgi:hypothetical protein
MSASVMAQDLRKAAYPKNGAAEMNMELIEE